MVNYEVKYRMPKYYAIKVSIRSIFFYTLLFYFVQKVQCTISLVIKMLFIMYIIDRYITILCIYVRTKDTKFVIISKSLPIINYN